MTLIVSDSGNLLSHDLGWIKVVGCIYIISCLEQNKWTLMFNV